MAAGEADLHPEEEREESSVGLADLVGQTSCRSGASAVGRLLRTPVLRPVPRVSSRPGLPQHASTTAAHFLGYEITAQHADTKITRGRRAVNGAIGLFVPKQVIKQRCQLYMKNGNQPNVVCCCTTRTSPSSRSTRPSTEGWSSTTSSPRTCSAWAFSTGSWRLRYSKPWPVSTVPRSPRWPDATK